MSGTPVQSQVKANPAVKSISVPAQSGLLLRKCACGGSAGVDGECKECREKKLTVQRRAIDGAELPGVGQDMESEQNGQGQALDAGTHANGSAGLTYDFSRMRVHAAPRGIQTKLTVNEPGDQYEQEADEVAEQVMRMEAPEISQEVGATGQAKNLPIQRLPLEGEKIHRQEEDEESDEEEETLQAKEISGHRPEVTPELQTRIDSIRGAGQSLPEATRAFMEPRFGYDFSQVRIHTDAQAAETARAVSAKAYTVGRDIVFGTGQYAPGTMTGRELLAHELTHVVQQKQSIPEQNISRQKPIVNLSKEGDAEEIEARRATNDVIIGRKTTISAFPPESTITLMRLPLAIPDAPEVPSRLSDAQLRQRSDQIYEQAVSAYLKQKGRTITKAMLGRFRKVLTVGVLQGVKNGKIVTLVNGHNPDFEEYIKASLKSGEEFVESVPVIPENVRTGQPRRSGHVHVHSEQVLAGEAKGRGISDAQVATSNNACNELCMSNLSENYPEVMHVNPAKSGKTKNIVEPAPSSKVSSTEASDIETAQTGKVPGKPAVKQTASPETPISSQPPSEEVVAHEPPLGGTKSAVKPSGVPETPEVGAIRGKVRPMVPEEGFFAGRGRSIAGALIQILIGLILAWLQVKSSDEQERIDKAIKGLEPQIQKELNALTPKVNALWQASLKPVYANITITFTHVTMPPMDVTEVESPFIRSFYDLKLKSVDVSTENIQNKCENIKYEHHWWSPGASRDFSDCTSSVLLEKEVSGPKTGTGAYAASKGYSLIEVDQHTHWESKEARKQFIQDYIRFAKEHPDLQKLYKEAITAYSKEL